ncbi:MAG: type II toxin-antitoxin system RelE family toxin [Thermomicrobiales bacterium]
MRYEVVLAGPAEAYLHRLDSRMRQRIFVRLEQIANDPFAPRLTTALTSPEGRRSARVGDYRIVFRVDSEAVVVNVSAIGPRGRVYRDR